MSKREHHYYVYIVASRTHVLYCGMTNSIQRRIEEHRQGLIPGFAETTSAIDSFGSNAINMSVTLSIGKSKSRGGEREKKIWLIEQENPTWADLSEAWRLGTAGPSTTLRSGRDDKG
jgi:putative endonuclease